MFDSGAVDPVEHVAARLLGTVSRNEYVSLWALPRHPPMSATPSAFARSGHQSLSPEQAARCEHRPRGDPARSINRAAGRQGVRQIDRLVVAFGALLVGEPELTLRAR